MDQAFHSEKIIDIQNVSVVAPNGIRILHDIQFSVNRGEHTVILGPNGSGKTSLINLITFRYRPYANPMNNYSVRVFGREQWNVAELRTHLGVVTPYLDGVFAETSRGIVGLEAVVSGYFSSQGIFPYQEVTDCMREHGREMLDLVESSYLAEKPVHEMSTGEVRRIMIARALAPEPAALLLDEPTSGLDLVARQHLLEVLRTIATSGRTIVLVTHHVEEIFPEIRHVVLMREGRVLASGNKDHLLTDRQITRTFGAAVRIERQNNGYYTARILTK